VSTQPTPASELDHRLRRLAPGWRFAGRYRMETLVGRGGMGVVWRARDETLDRSVALKFLIETLVHDPSAIDDLKRETRRALELTHHNIVRVYDFVEDRGEGLAGIAMEFFPGQTLAARRIAVTARCFEPETVVPWVAQLCDAMAYAHEKVGVIHRDLKPQNLMLDDRGELKITDFGIARVASDSLSRISIGKISGTPSYMSPQQARGESPTVTDDVYAIGATIYELLTSRPPFWQGDVPSQVGTIVPPRITERRRELTSIDREIPRIWEETIAACLDKDPAKRPRSAREIADRLGISLPTTHSQSAPAVQMEHEPQPIHAPSVDLAALQTDTLEAPTLAGVTIVQPATSVRERSHSSHIPPPHPAGSESKEPEFPIPRYLWITGIGIALAALAFTGGAMIRRLGAKPEPAKQASVSAPQKPRAMGSAFVPDEFPTIQAAINSVQAGETITLRPGVYRESITLKEGVRIVGEKTDACRIVPPEGAAALVFARGVRQCIVENLTLDGSEVADRTARSDGIAISDAEITVSGCIIRGMSGTGIVVHGTDTAAEISANRIENNGLHGILLLRTGSTVALRRNEIRQSKGAGIAFNEGATGLAEENVCEQNGDSGILAAGVATAPSLQSNRCNHNENHGISFMGAARGSVAGNTCDENGESGLAGIGEGTAPEFVKNTARRNTRYGIYIATGADGDATGNLCEANHLSGIGITGTSTRPALSGNQLVRNQKFGIESSNGASPRIAPDNVFAENVAGEISR
jgi:serine/threonine protein kinase